MSEFVKINNGTFYAREKFLERQCQKLQKFLPNEAEINCNLIPLKRGVRVKINVFVLKRQFSVDVAGSRFNNCAIRAFSRLKRQFFKYQNKIKDGYFHDNFGAHSRSIPWVV